jgi:hypothetical protein
MGDEIDARRIRAWEELGEGETVRIDGGRIDIGCYRRHGKERGKRGLGRIAVSVGMLGVGGEGVWERDHALPGSSGLTLISDLT